MKPEKLAKHQKTLRVMRDRLVNEVDRLAQSINEEAFPPGEISSLPTHTADLDSEGLTKEIALEENESAMLADVVAALERIDEGTYGKCADCGREIPQARLDAIPYTAYCRDCQEQLETAS